MDEDIKMNEENISLLFEKVKEAELVLIGIGEEYEVRFDKINVNDEDTKIRKMIYQKVTQLLSGKNYFIVSLCTDGVIRKQGLDDTRIVEPCGNYTYLQCSEKCSVDLYDAESGMNICPKCGKPLVFNRLEETGAQYVEEGYLENWKTYTKWLQGTVNRKVCILELGVGMKYPSVIRFPFEKVAYFNQKASFFRVHSRLYQVTEEIKDRSYGIKATPDEFLKELSNKL